MQNIANHTRSNSNGSQSHIEDITLREI